MGSPRVVELECAVCREERDARHRVMNRKDENIHTDTAPSDFTTAPAIFPNNDIKYEVNKRRAEILSAATKQAITWCPAKDHTCTEVLNGKENITEEKVKWLTWQDKACGDLVGLLPLAIGLPVALTDHLDRNPEKNLLRGRIGYIDSWVLAVSEDTCFEEGRRIRVSMAARIP